MVADPVFVNQIPKPADRSANKPIYLVEVEHPGSKGKVKHYRVTNLVKFQTHISISGFELSNAQAEGLRENPNAKEVAGREINYEIPWHRVVRIENVTYKKQKAQGEKNDD